MHVDAHFAGGRGHPVCQDYALACPGAAVVCDGCSTAEHSDVGARLLAHAALRPGAALGDPSWLAGVQAASRLLGLPEASLDATCILARARAQAIVVTMLGDGVVAARRVDDGRLSVIEVDFERAAPPYPSYRLCPRRSAAYLEAGLGTPRVRAPQDAPAPAAEAGALTWVFPRDQFSAVFIGSDGLAAFRRDDRSLVPTATVIEGLSRFPSHRGAFVTRRLRRFLAKQAPRAGMHPEDDVALAALCWGAA